MKLPEFINYTSEIMGLHAYKLDIFRDERGGNYELYNKAGYYENNFALDSTSFSKKNVLRGFHGDFINDKLIQCLSGSIQFYVIDTRIQSPTYNHVKEFILSDSEPIQVLVPQGVVNAHLALTDNVIFWYKWSHGYVPIDQQIHIKWNDPKFKDKVNWMTQNPILSNRDK